MFFLSIKWRLSLTATAIALFLIASISVIGLAMLKTDLAANIAERQSVLVQQAARDLDSKLAADLDTVARVASVIPEIALHDVEAFRQHFADRPELFSTFDSFVLIGTDGTPLAGIPTAVGRPVQNYVDRAYFKEVVRTRKPVISDPLMSKVNSQPLVVMAAPVRNAQGNIEGVLAALLYLRQPNVLGNLATAKVGNTGYFFLVTRSEPSRYVMHPDASRILAERPAIGTPSTTRALTGAESSVEDTNSSGVHALFSYASLGTTGWLLASVLPTDEAFAALRTAGWRAVFIGLLASLVVGPLVWYLAWRLLTPLSHLSNSIQRTLEDGETWVDVPVKRSDEIGLLARSFNALIGDLKTKERALQESEQWLRSVTDSLPALVCYISPDHRFVFNNKTYEQWLQRPLAEIVGKPVRDVYGPDVYERLAPSLSAALDGKRTKFEVEFKGRDGTSHYARGQYVPHRNGDGRVIGVFGLITDETRLKAAETALQASEKRLLDITNNVPAVIGQFDMQERCVFANDVGLKVHGIDRSEIAGLTFGSHIEPVLYAQHAAALKDVLQGKPSIVDGEREIKGRSVWFKAHLVPALDPAGVQRGFYVMTFDVTGLKIAERKLARLAHFDNLTGLPNRLHFNDYLREAFATTRDARQSLALMFLDIDHFKQINDTLGHAAGDSVLRDFSTRVTAAVRSTDFCARLAGDEFVVVLRGLTTRKQAQGVAAKIVRQVGKPFIVEELELSVTVSVGIAFGDSADSPNELLAKADDALYRAKENGRNQFHLAT